MNLLNWWYSRGFSELLGGFKEHLQDAEDFFSLKLLVQNFFSPFRQISAQGTSSLALGDKMRAFFDLLVSRLIGTVVRFLILIVGLIVIVLQIAMGVLMVIVWPLVPLSVVCGVVLFFSGVVF